jgi:hypothetical protein
VPQASILGKHLVNEAPLTLGELTVPLNLHCSFTCLGTEWQSIKSQ